MSLYCYLNYPVCKQKLKSRRQERERKRRRRRGRKRRKAQGWELLPELPQQKFSPLPLALLAGPVGRSELRPSAVSDRAPRRQPADRREESVAWKFSQVIWRDGLMPDTLYRGIGWHK